MAGNMHDAIIGKYRIFVWNGDWFKESLKMMHNEIPKSMFIDKILYNSSQKAGLNRNIETSELNGIKMVEEE